MQGGVHQFGNKLCLIINHARKLLMLKKQTLQNLLSRIQIFTSTPCIIILRVRLSTMTLLLWVYYFNSIKISFQFNYQKELYFLVWQKARPTLATSHFRLMWRATPLPAPMGTVGLFRLLSGCKCKPLQA